MTERNGIALSAFALALAGWMLAGVAAAAEDILIADFEGKDYGEWQATGDAFGPGPARGTLPRQGRVRDFLGKGLVNTYFNGDRTTGTLTSPEIKIQRRYINFLIGGGRHLGETCIRLFIAGKPARTASGPNDQSRGSERLDWCTWDVAEFLGESARIRIIDEYRYGWGHINIDHIVQSDTAKSKRVIGRYDGEVTMADFEAETYDEWRAEGDAFGPGPTRASTKGYRPITQYHGQRFASSRNKGNKGTGTLTGPAFRIERGHISFRIAGGNWPGVTCANLLVDGQVVRTRAGDDHERLSWATWNVADLKGQTGRIQVVDKHSGHLGYVAVDHFLQEDRFRSFEITADAQAAREKALAALERHGVQDIVFATRQVDRDGHWYANFSYWSNRPKRTLYHEGGRLCRLNVATGQVTYLLDDFKGGVRDPQVHYDGKRILFSYRKAGQPYYHLYEIGVDGAGLRQITDGPYDDIEPSYLPDGDIVFCSSRCNRMVNCYYVRVAIVYRCDADGGHVRPLSSNIEHDNTPWPLPDGRILHQRWEYVDRSQVAYHHLWTMNPDGTGQMVYFGNMHPSTVMIDAKPIPGGNQIVASFSPGHGRNEHAGRITVVDARMGPDHRPSARTLNRERYYRDPYPLSADCFLVAGSSDMLVMDGAGQVGRVYDLPLEEKLAGVKLHEPRPVLPRPRERIIPQRADPKQTTGRLVLEDVCEGRNMRGVRAGEVKKLLVLETLPKPVNFTGGWEPITYGGTFTLERILGTIPVEPDGSAYAEVPALRPLFFVALDENDMAVKRMQSFLTVQPGETLSCVGCHEQRVQAPPPKAALMATARAPSRIQPIPDAPDLFDFPRDIQPILDRHCVACHDYEATPRGGPRSGGTILSGDRGPVYSHSYYCLTAKGQLSDGRNLARGNFAPRTLGSSASPLLNKLDAAHHGVKLSAREKAMIRLWIDSAAAYPGTYAALGSGMVGSQGWGKATKPVLERRCWACHKGDSQLPESPGDNLGIRFSGRIDPKSPAVRFSPQGMFNLTRPDKSLLLLAPLAKDAGGYGLCADKANDAKAGQVFAGVDDPDYQALLAAVRRSKKHLDAIKRFDMPGFRPNPHYIREMQFYGVLPKALKPTDPIDPYRTDRVYWRSLWYRPPSR